MPSWVSIGFSFGDRSSILERHRGREVVGVVRGMGVSWQLGMKRDRGLSR